MVFQPQASATWWKLNQIGLGSFLQSWSSIVGSTTSTSSNFSILSRPSAPSRLTEKPHILSGGVTITRTSKVTLHSDNCVRFLTVDLHVKLPLPLLTFEEKLAQINVYGNPQIGDVAVIQLYSGDDMQYGHLALVVAITATSLTIFEANWFAGCIDFREAIALDVFGAQLRLHIVGYIRPKN